MSTTFAPRVDETLTLALEVYGYDEQAFERAEMLVAATQRVLPTRGKIGIELGEENTIGFFGDETQLRYLMNLGTKRGWVYDGDTFEEIAGLE
jgi:hypothetical protein